jgi:hypothetical protein
MITLNTIIYEGNFNDFLKEDNWFFTFESKYVTRKLITVNNLSSFDEFNKKVNELRINNDFDVIYVEDNLEKVKEIFNLDINQTDTGYYYTIPYFVSIYNTDTEYFFNVASDCMFDINISDDFFESSFEELHKNNLCMTTMVGWFKNNPSIAEYEESETNRLLNKDIPKSNHFFIRYNFTDQLFLGLTKKLKTIDYNVSESISSAYYPGPAYGGNCYEKRMVGIHIKYNFYSFVYKKNNYFIHNTNK